MLEPQFKKRILTKFRFGISDLYIHSNTYKVNETQIFICLLCRQENEDEVHFMLRCPFLIDIREIYIAAKYWRQPSLFKLVLLLASTNEQTVKNTMLYLCHAFTLRNDVAVLL